MKPEEKTDVVIMLVLEAMVLISVIYFALMDTSACRSFLVMGILLVVVALVTYWRLREKRKQSTIYYFYVFLIIGILYLLSMLVEYCTGG